MDNERFSFPRTELRNRAARGAIVNGVFLLAVEALGVLQAVVVARLLSADQVGLYGIASVTVMTLLSLKQIGIDEAYIQQEEANQEEAFNQAFSIDLMLSLAFSVLTAAAAPLVAVLYGDSSVAPLMVALALMPILFALQAPAWIYLRRMDFIRQRSLQAVVPLVTLIVTVSLVIAGLGAWGLVLGALAGNAAAALVAVAVSPFELRITANKTVVRHYMRFSAPIALAAICGLVIRQGQTLAFNTKLGLAGVGYLTLAVTLTRYADRADQLITQTIYPAICAVREMPSRLIEAFEKSNRLTAMWALPFGALTVLFAEGFVHWVIGPKWAPAVELIQLVGLSTAIYQLGFNWTAFHRALGRTRQQTIYAIAGLIAFLAVPLPLLFLKGAAGFGWGLLAVNAIAGGLRWFYMRELLPGVGIRRLVWRSFIPPVVAAVPVVIWQSAQSQITSPWVFALQILSYLILYAVMTIVLERALLSEALGYLRTRGENPLGATP